MAGGVWLLAHSLAAGAAQASCDSTAACLQAIEAAQRDTRTISAEFEQVKHLSLLDEPLVSTGKFVFKRPDRILWKVEQPRPLAVVINGREVHIPSLPERDRQALAMTPLATMFQQMGALFTGDVRTVEQSFEVTAREDGAAIRVTLVPRRDEWKRMFRAVEMRFAAPEFLVEQLRLDDPLGDNLEITFRNARRNLDVADSTFEVPEH